MRSTGWRRGSTSCSTPGHRCPSFLPGTEPLPCTICQSKSFEPSLFMHTVEPSASIKVCNYNRKEETCKLGPHSRRARQASPWRSFSEHLREQDLILDPLIAILGP